jgi:trans-2,3-dihydro-3-hydroxyanthranilate isomerase
MNRQIKSTTKATDVPFAMYDAFTEVPYSGSQAGVVLDASDISMANRTRIAREIGVPATAFVSAINGNRIVVQFFSTVMELPMCGHGTVCLITRLVELGLLPDDGDGWQKVVLELPKGEAHVEYRHTSSGRVEVMLEVTTPQFSKAAIDLATLAQILGVELADISDDLPTEIAAADFVHLCLPMRDLAAMRDLRPDFSALATFCVSKGLETIAAFSTDVVDGLCNLHVRDFCPAVGVAESAAAGTTNAALSVYLWHKGRAQSDANGTVLIRAEQGIELGRPSNVTTRIKIKDDQITRLQVGGVASRIIEGVLNVNLVGR